ncbi:hypothetical protein [Xanthomonas sp. MUS 060]|uniref:hypothetical protein n=1 Tax=Xanthomonas sp. MUS 060 TaxID=1588031 RepID=UPI000AC0DA7A|nr:hypothetical protein [Xanthomonas sp. MUS 060]
MNAKIKFAGLLALSVFLLDVVRRCWIVDAWSALTIFFVLAVLSLYATRKTWRAARRSHLPADFVRPNSPDFPAQPRRGIR